MEPLVTEGNDPFYENNFSSNIPGAIRLGGDVLDKLNPDTGWGVRAKVSEDVAAVYSWEIYRTVAGMEITIHPTHSNRYVACVKASDNEDGAVLTIVCVGPSIEYCIESLQCELNALSDAAGCSSAALFNLLRPKESTDPN